MSKRRSGNPVVVIIVIAIVAIVVVMVVGNVAVRGANVVAKDVATTAIAATAVVVMVVIAVVDPKKVSHLSEMMLKFVGVRLSRSDAVRPAALGSEAKRNGDGRAQYYLSRSQRVLFRIFLYYRLADCGINETR